MCEPVLKQLFHYVALKVTCSLCNKLKLQKYAIDYNIYIGERIKYNSQLFVFSENASPLCIAPGGGCFCKRSDCHKMDGGTVP